jgi:outer membrane protein OmpA-like peptidoglycan-associated protein
VLDSNGNETPLRWEQMLDLLAENLLRYRDRIRAVVLVGHTDDVASEKYNLWLGRKRVEFVVEELRRRGVPAELLQAESAGESQLLPRRPGEPLEQWRRRCRRVELSKVLQAP